jgi:flagellar basal-body rod protein FlgB
VNLFDSTQVGLEQAIAGAGMRQSTLAANIANANTPGYARRDVDFHSALRSAMDAGTPERASFAAAPDGSGAMTPDGNTVDIDTESASLAANGMEYEALVSVARGRNDILRSALGLGG